MSTKDLYNQRLERILKVVALEKPDRTPVVLEYSGFAAYATQTPMTAFLKSPRTNIDTMIKTFELVGDGDAINYGAFWPYGLCYDFMAKVCVPGVDLAENEMWQVTETQLMDRNDYDRILQHGWLNFFQEIMHARILNDVPPEYLPPQRRSVDIPAYSKNFRGQNVLWPLMVKPIFLKPGKYWMVTCVLWEMFRPRCCF